MGEPPLAGVKLMQQKVLKVSRRYRFSFLSYCEKTRGGGGEKRPPPVNGGLMLPECRIDTGQASGQY